MTQSNPKKMLKQLNAKPGKIPKYMKHNMPKKRTCGIARISCELCGRHRGVIRKYGLYLCRQFFRENAYKLGFKKFR